MDADIICLQGVDEYEWFEEFLYPNGFTGIFESNKPAELSSRIWHCDGLAIFWRSSKFKLVGRKAFTLGDQRYISNIALCARLTKNTSSIIPKLSQIEQEKIEKQFEFDVWNSSLLAGRNMKFEIRRVKQSEVLLDRIAQVSNEKMSKSNIKYGAMKSNKLPVNPNKGISQKAKEIHKMIDANIKSKFGDNAGINVDNNDDDTQKNNNDNDIKNDNDNDGETIIVSPTSAKVKNIDNNDNENNNKNDDDDKNLESNNNESSSNNDGLSKLQKEFAKRMSLALKNKSNNTSNNSDINNASTKPLNDSSNSVVQFNKYPTSLARPVILCLDTNSHHEWVYLEDGDDDENENDNNNNYYNKPKYNRIPPFCYSYLTMRSRTTLQNQAYGHCIKAQWHVQQAQKHSWFLQSAYALGYGTEPLLTTYQRLYPTSNQTNKNKKDAIKSNGKVIKQCSDLILFTPQNFRVVHLLDIPDENWILRHWNKSLPNQNYPSVHFAIGALIELAQPSSIQQTIPQQTPGNTVLQQPPQMQHQIPQQQQHLQQQIPQQIQHQIQQQQRMQQPGNMTQPQQHQMHPQSHQIPQQNIPQNIQTNIHNNMQQQQQQINLQHYNRQQQLMQQQAQQIQQQQPSQFSQNMNIKPF